MPKYFTGVWTPQVTSTPNRWVICSTNDTLQIAFDVYVLGLLLWNAMDRPRLPNDKLLRMLYEDGVFLIIVSFQYPTSMAAIPTKRYYMSSLQACWGAMNLKLILEGSEL